MCIIIFMKRGVFVNSSAMNKLIAHFDKYFRQNNATVLHPALPSEMHIDVLVYPPNEVYPFWKLATMGASDYKMPDAQNALCERNEYMMFVSPEEDLSRLNDTLRFYHLMLMEVAHYPCSSKVAITYGHSLEWRETEGSDMIGAFIEMPQIIQDPEVLYCKTGLFTKTACLQVVLLTSADIEQLMQIGPRAFSSYLYPDPEYDAPVHFLCEKNRSDRFYKKNQCKN